MINKTRLEPKEPTTSNKKMAVIILSLIIALVVISVIIALVISLG